jgi:hypothetical protein
MDKLDQELTKAAKALENFAKANSTPSQGDQMTQAEFDSLLTTIKTIGAEGLKKSIARMTDKQLILVQTVLEKATSMDKEAVKQPEPLRNIVTVAEPRPEGGADTEDEKLVKEENKNICPQGDDSELPGQVIKSMSDEELRALVRRMVERKFSKSACMGALEQYGQSKEKMEKMFDAEAPMEKAEDKPADADANSKADKDIKEGLKSDDGLDKKPEEKKEEPKPAPTMEAKPAEEKPQTPPPFQKSVTWKNPLAPWLEAKTKRGRNAHYGVDSAIEAAEARTNEMKKSGWIDSDPYAPAPEKLQKATGAKASVNDLIEQRLDFDPLQLELAKARKDWKPSGAFNTKSFDEGDFRFAPSQPVLAKAMPKGEGARGGHVIGHTKTGKPVYSDPKHPEHGKFSDEDHYDAHLAHGQHQRKHESELNKPVRGRINEHMAHVDQAQYHGKMADKHLGMVKQKDSTKLHPHLKTLGDVADHARKVATSAFKPSDQAQSSTPSAPEQKQKA